MERVSAASAEKRQSSSTERKRHKDVSHRRNGVHKSLRAISTASLISVVAIEKHEAVHCGHHNCIANELVAIWSRATSRATKGGGATKQFSALEVFKKVFIC